MYPRMPDQLREGNANSERPLGKATVETGRVLRSRGPLAVTRSTLYIRKTEYTH